MCVWHVKWSLLYGMPKKTERLMFIYRSLFSLEGQGIFCFLFVCFLVCTSGGARKAVRDQGTFSFRQWLFIRLQEVCKTTVAQLLGLEDFFKRSDSHYPCCHSDGHDACVIAVDDDADDVGGNCGWWWWWWVSGGGKGSVMLMMMIVVTMR